MVRLLLRECPKRTKIDVQVFQSHNGAIAALRPVNLYGPTVKFQSHNGAIAARFSVHPKPRWLGVSIPQWCDCCKVGLSCRGIKKTVSIPQWCDCCLNGGTLISNGTKVSIPQWCDCCERTCGYGTTLRQRFNPTMVRLLPGGGSGGGSGGDSFQSHNGAIAASFFQLIMSPLPRFQSHNGAIAAPLRLWLLRIVSIVSIPQWCDCCFFRDSVAFASQSRFNPTMVRLLPFLLLGCTRFLTRFNPTMVRLLPRQKFRI